MMPRRSRIYVTSLRKTDGLLRSVIPPAFARNRPLIAYLITLGVVLKILKGEVFKILYMLNANADDTKKRTGQ
ncbi:hypothetical protein LMG24235_01020 [Paraburkholderia sabiae]|nr:hypothetical protein LMG24235_01020 [Paraburkholderia sabiae]